jgi:hypothetical protein
MGLEFRRLRWDRGSLGCGEALFQKMSILELYTAHALSDEPLSETYQANRRHVRDFRAPTHATSPTGNRVERLWNHRTFQAQLHCSAEIATAITAVP